MVKEAGSRQGGGVERAPRHRGRCPGKGRAVHLAAERNLGGGDLRLLGMNDVGDFVRAGAVAVDRIPHARSADDQVLQVGLRGDQALKVLRRRFLRVEQVPGG
jgi:hypothetical protein